MKLTFERTDIAHTYYFDQKYPDLHIIEELQPRAEDRCWYDHQNKILLRNLSERSRNYRENGEYYELMIIDNDPILLLTTSQNTVTYQRTKITEKYAPADLSDLVLSTLSACYNSKFKFAETKHNKYEPLSALDRFGQLKKTNINRGFKGLLARNEIKRPKVVHLVKFFLGMRKNYNQLGKLAQTILHNLAIADSTPCTSLLRFQASFNQKDSKLNIIIINNSSLQIRSIVINVEKLINSVFPSSKSFSDCGSTSFHYGARNESDLSDVKINIDNINPEESKSIQVDFISWSSIQSSILTVALKRGFLDFKARDFQVYVEAEEV
jgi:hypothetical protein